MRVIAHGKMVGTSDIHGCCVSCYCKVAFKASEAVRVPDSRDGDYYQIKCPECPGFINVDVRVADQCHRVAKSHV